MIYFFHRQLAKTLAMGQGLAVLICGTAISSQYLTTNYHVNTPMLQSLLNYALLCLTYMTMLLFRRGNHITAVNYYYITLWHDQKSCQYELDVTDSPVLCCCHADKQSIIATENQGCPPLKHRGWQYFSDSEETMVEVPPAGLCGCRSQLHSG